MRSVDNEMKGALFPNDKGDNEMRPDMRGEVTIEGVKYSVSAWKNTSKGGKPYLGLKVSEWKERSAEQAPQPQQQKQAPLDDAIPF